MFLKINFFKHSFRYTGPLLVSNGLDPDQDQRPVGPNLSPNCLQRLSAEDESHCAARKELIIFSYLCFGEYKKVISTI